jgi:uncharacterized protein (DUF2062 family)
MAPEKPKTQTRLSFIGKRFQYSLNTVKDYLKQGMSEKKLSLAILFGIFLGISPLIGLTTIATATIATLLRLNMVVIQTIQYTLAPLQLILFVPFMRAGILFTGHQHETSLNNSLAMFKHDWLTAAQNIGSLHLASIAIWAVIATPLIFLLNKRIILLLQKLKQNQQSTP